MSDEFSNESRSLEVLPTSEMVLLIDDDNAKKDRYYKNYFDLKIQILNVVQYIENLFKNEIFLTVIIFILGVIVLIEMKFYILKRKLNIILLTNCT